MTKKKPAKPALRVDKRPVGRPSTYTPEIANEICARIALCESLKKICEDEGMPGIRTVMDWQRLHDDFRLNMAMAREHRADARSDEIDALIDQVKSGALDPHAGRVAIDAHKWQASKENLGRYGDRSVSEHIIKSGPDMESISETQQWIDKTLAADGMPNNVILLPAKEVVGGDE
jgi:hypothetical protein